MDTVYPKNYAYDLCFVEVWYRSFKPISFRVALMALGQSYDCPSASEATLKDMGE